MLADAPDAVVVSQDLHLLLSELAALLQNRLAIVSGRAISVLRELGVGDFTLVGSHGLEIAMANSPIERADRPEALDTVISALEKFAATRAGILVERKPLSVGLHYRLGPQYEGECRTITETLASEHDLFVQKGKMLFEIRPKHGDKGQGIRELMTRRQFSGARPMFIGDDVTDENGFEAVLSLGGDAILVGEPRASAAQFLLAGPAEVVNWLDMARHRMKKAKV